MENQLTVIKSAVEITKHGPKSLYRCSCGTEKVILDHNVKYGRTLSCGCFMRRRASETSTTHGAVGTRAYGIWAGMRGRCLVKSNKGYPKYGGAGITICPEWDSFQKFLDDMGTPGPTDTIDRIDGAKGYYKENCRWASYEVQAQNTRSYRNNSTGRKGVTYCNTRKMYVARITTKGKGISLGRFKKFADAVKAREEGEIKYFTASAP